jgi:hypothetical protein
MVRLARFAVAVAAIAAGWGSLAGSAGAAPLDALLDLVDDPQGPARWTVEAAGDVTQPLFDAVGIDRRAGQTASVRLRLVSGPWSVELGGHQRAIQDKSNDYRVQSWHGTVQFEPGEARSTDPLRWGVRLGAWGNQADHLLQSTNASLKISGLKARLVEMELVQPRDLQWQMDVIGRATLNDPRWAVSGFVGAGTSTVTRSVVSGKATISGCTYQLQFGEERLDAQPMADCPKALVVSVPNNLLAVDVLDETRYRSVYGRALERRALAAGTGRRSAAVAAQRRHRAPDTQCAAGQRGRPRLRPGAVPGAAWAVHAPPAARRGADALQRPVHGQHAPGRVRVDRAAGDVLNPVLRGTVLRDGVIPARA